MINRLLCLVLFMFASSCSRSNGTDSTNKPDTTGATFTNPLLSSGPDPWVISKDGKYYYTNTLGNRIGCFP